MADESFSFRWGIPILDKGHTDIPNFILDHYAQAGVSRSEFLVIVHLARYQFESPNSECRPSVVTVADQMGYSVRGLQKVLAGLEERGLLVRRYRPGDTTVYDFTDFSQAMLEAELSTVVNPSSSPNGLRDEPQFTPTPEPQFTPGVNPSSPKEEKQEEKQQEKKAAAGPPDSVMCSIHNVPMGRREKDGATWYSHRLPGGGWCKGAAGDQPTRGDPHTETVRGPCGVLLPAGRGCEGRGWECCDGCELRGEADGER
jgi:DNA-binding MarR family transcriptional regulator